MEVSNSYFYFFNKEVANLCVTNNRIHDVRARVVDWELKS